MNSKMVEISEDKYQELLEAWNWLGCLEGAGVDNWEGYDFAKDIYQERYGSDD